MNKKILNFSDLKNIRNKFKKKKIVLAHGTFDFFHYGHLKHFEKSKEKGDILVVSLTADRFVKKGPGRPVYNQLKRAEIISSISFVDYIVISNSLSGNEVIKTLKPNYYSKGIEYKNKKNDYTNKISKEEENVKKNGGMIFYTNEEVFSASKLINELSTNKNSKKSSFIQKFKNKNNFLSIYNDFKKINNKKILIIGDAILDEYVFTTALAKSPKEELISVKEDKRKIYFGGILATAQHISNFVEKPTLLTVVGNETKTNLLIKKNLKHKMNLILFEDKNRKNIIKTRFLDTNKKKLFQSNEVPFKDINIDLEKKIFYYLNKSLKNFDLVIINDFGHGLLTSKLRRLIEKKSKKLSINVQTNSANLGFNFFDKYKKCDYLTMDEPEARIATKERFGSTELLLKKILNKIKAKKVAITFGPNGTKIYSKKKIFYVPSLTSNAVDTLGAGDAFFAISSIYTLTNNDAESIAFIGNTSGALKIQYVGHEKYIKPDVFFEYLKSLLS